MKTRLLEQDEDEAVARLIPSHVDPTTAQPLTVAESLVQTSSSGRWEECLLEDEALGFAQGQLSRASHQRVLEHLDACSVCQRVTNEALHQVGGVRPAGPSKGWLCNFAPGAKLARRYSIQRYIARGGMGEVYEAHDDLLDEDVALKTVVVTACDSRHAQSRLRSEVQLARGVTHPNVCRVHDVHQHRFDDGMSLRFSSMQLLRGQTLRRRLRAGPPSWAEVTSVVRQLLSGLGAIHRAGVVHCDLKSDNIMLLDGPDATPHVVIIDFGLARTASTVVRRPLGRCASGSPPYMAPEQLRGDAIAPATDVYAVGVVLFEALTGQLPYGKDPHALRALAAWRHALPLHAPSQICSGLSPLLDAFVLRCLAPESRDRFPNAEQAAEELERALDLPVRVRRRRPSRAPCTSARALVDAPGPA